MERKIRCLINGRLVVESDARISAFDRGFLYADGVFETLRVYGGNPFRLAEHWHRMGASAAFFGLPRPPDDPEALVHAVLAANRLEDASVRITLSRGPLPSGPRPQTGETLRPTLLVQARPLRPGLDEVQERGMEGQLTPWPTRARGCPLHQHKTLAYLSSILALADAKSGREPLLWNSHGHLAEGATSNLFWVREAVLHTPSLEAGCLPGVTRRLVVELARARGIAVAAGFFSPAELHRAEEALLTNSVIEVAPLVAVDDRPIGDGVPGPLTRQLQHAYRESVRREGRRP